MWADDCKRLWIQTDSKLIADAFAGNATLSAAYLQPLCIRRNMVGAKCGECIMQRLRLIAGLVAIRRGACPRGAGLGVLHDVVEDPVGLVVPNVRGLADVSPGTLAMFS